MTRRAQVERTDAEARAEAQETTHTVARGQRSRRPGAAWRGMLGLVLAVFALAALASPADARPKRKDARVAFDRGVAAYKKGNYAAASESLARSFAIEGDVETLFAWAQSERKLERCDNAIELYEKLLTFDLSAANKEAVNNQLTECRAQIAAEHKVEPPAEPPAAPGNSTPLPTTKPADASGEPSPVTERPTPSEPVGADTQPRRRSWYKNPIVLGLTGSGLIAVGVGGGFLLSARAADADIANKAKAPDRDTAKALADKAKSREKTGLITMGVGGALVVGGVVVAILTRNSGEQRTMTGWLAPGGGGLALTGLF